MDWNPQGYGKFAAEREAPYADLSALIAVEPKMRVVDLGCGTGRLTARLCERLPDASVVGIDSSAKMLAEAATLAGPRLAFVSATIEAFAAGGAVDGEYDLIFSNAALHWVGDHPSLLPKLVARLGARGQLAVQLPADDYNSARAIFAEVAGWRHELATLDIGAYARILYEAGLVDLAVYEKIYPHVLADADAVLEWSSSTALLPYLRYLPQSEHAYYLDEVRRRLRERHPEKPVFFPFRRIIFYGRRAYNVTGDKR